MTAQQCRAAVWARDDGRDRASGHLLARWSLFASLQGEVHHLKGRRVKPEWKTDPDHQILLSRENHRLATGVWGGKLLTCWDPEDPTQPATDATRPILFIRRDAKGVELWRTIR